MKEIFRWKAGDMKEIYLVMGSTGEYEAHHTWVVKAYLSKELAEHHAMRARQRGEEIIEKALGGKEPEWCGSLDYERWEKVMDEEKNEFDGRFHADSCGQSIDYYVASNPIELDETPPNS